MALDDRDYMRERQRRTNARVRRRDAWERVSWWLREGLRLALVMAVAWAVWQLARRYLP